MILISMVPTNFINCSNQIRSSANLESQMLSLYLSNKREVHYLLTPDNSCKYSVLSTNISMKLRMFESPIILSNRLLGESI